MSVIPKVERKLISTLETEIGKFDYYSNIIVSVIKEGVHVTADSTIQPLHEGARVFGYEKSFVYISHRLNSYSIDPTGYYESASMFTNFKALAIVATSRRRRMLANLERLFMKRPIHVFDNLEDAFLWAEEFLENQS